MTVTCVYCGQAYPDETPTSHHSALYEHIRGCKQHPLFHSRQENSKLQVALQAYADGYTGPDLAVEALADTTLVYPLRADEAQQIEGPLKATLTKFFKP